MAPVHPRACGENCWSVLTASPDGGSSPRVRGKFIGTSDYSDSVRFIPARAGKIPWLPYKNTWRSVHPRACGENGTNPAWRNDEVGSSPRVRGKFIKDALHHQDARFIPARAGKMQGAWRDSYEHPVHPRACGENCAFSASEPNATGSSPRVRGK